MTKAIIIESLPGRRRLDPRQSSPRSLIPLESGQPSALQWTIRSLEESGVSDITYVGGYHIEKVIQSFPHISFRYLPLKGQASELDALLSCEPPNDACLIIRATTILMPGAIPELAGGGASFGTYHSNGIERDVGVYAYDRDHTDELFTLAHSFAQSSTRAGLGDLARRLGAKKIPLDGLTAPTDDKSAVGALIFRGKAQTLENLAPLSKKAKVLPLERFTAHQWKTDRDTILERIQNRFGADQLVIRSSTVSEDSLGSSMAGQFLSILNVDAQDRPTLVTAIEDVINSYGESGRSVHPEDEVLVQPHVQKLVASGVLLTRDPQYGSPYFVVNIDSESGRTDLVTSGGEGEIETLYVAWNQENQGHLNPTYMQVIDIGRELIELSHTDSLDIEFGLDANEECHLFQVRPLTCVEPNSVDDDEDILDIINHVHEFVEEASRPRPGIFGDDNLFGNMSDWNPAEMIGANPRPLSLSLYQTLIGNNAWGEARARLGYRDTSSIPLIVSLGGRAYVDIRASLNSLLPEKLDENIGQRWTNYCLKKLRDDPPLHDKIEFELAVTCLTPEWGRHEEWLVEAGLNSGEREQFRSHLAQITTAMVNGKIETIADQFADISRMTKRRDQLQAMIADNVSGLGCQVNQVVGDCIRWGIVPFSILARYAFIAMSMLKGLRAVQAISADAYDQILRAIPTVSRQFSVDAERLSRNEIALDEMVRRYGHLRPHSYDILSGNYASLPEQYFQSTGSIAMHDEPMTRDPVDIFMDNRSSIEAALDKVGLQIEPETLAKFIVQAISGRENAKFEFMKSLNLILEAIAKIGAIMDIPREVLSFVPVHEFTRLEANSASRALESHLRRISGHNEKQWMLAKTLRLPDLITEPGDIYAHRQDQWRPNFVTRKHVTATPVLLSEPGDLSDGIVLENAIVLIRAADPGFDWIFCHPIAGLVTQYGGVASHMAIRAAEYGLPAAIGCGEALFEKLSQAKTIELDCGNHLVRAVE